MAKISIAVALLLVAQATSAAVPDVIAYQGLLLDAGGQPASGPTQLRFRIFRGGDGTTAPSNGVLVYHERATVTPAHGVVSHLIGSGVPAADCAGGPCVLDAGAFGPGDVPVWIEVTRDPDGVVGSSDDERFLPRIRVGTVGYAYRAASLEGALGAALGGTVTADRLEGRTGLVLGDEQASSAELQLEAAAGATSVSWDPGPGELQLAATTRHALGLTLDPTQSIAFGPIEPGPISPHLRLNHWTALGADGDANGQPDTVHTLSLCYNCLPGASTREVNLEYAMHAQWDMTASTAVGDRRIYNAWNFLAPGQVAFQPFQFYVATDYTGAYAHPNTRWAFRNSRNHTALSFHPNGNVLVGSEAFQPAARLDVVGSIHSSENVELDLARELRFGSASALTTDAAGTYLRLGAGFPEVRVEKKTRFEQGLTVTGGAAISWGPQANPVPGTYIRQMTTGGVYADGNRDGSPDKDNVWGICYNCRESAAVPDVAGEYQMIAQWEMTYAPAVGERKIEHNFDFRSPAWVLFRPLAFVIDTDHDGGYADPRASWTWETERNEVALHINRNGNVLVGANSPAPAYPLEISGTLRGSELRLDSGGSVVLDGERALHTDAAGTLVLGEDQGSVATGSAAFVLSSCPTAQAEPSLTIGDCNVVLLVGSASVHSIQTCDATRAGRVLHVLCGAGGAQLCDDCGNGNLLLTNNLDCTGDDTLTLVCDGTVWRETARSVN